MKQTHRYLTLFIAVIFFIAAIILITTGASSAFAAPSNVPSPTVASLPTILSGGVAEESGILPILQIAIGLLLIASLVGIVTERLRVPYTAGLVLIGLVMALVGQREINLSPDIFLSLLVPPLVFEAAFQANAKDLLKDLAPILSLAVPGVLLTTLLVGLVLFWGADFPLVLALLFGSLIAATDPVAVVSLFRALRVPNRLQLLLEGESLLNDGTSIVLFNLMVAIAVTGTFHLGNSILQFLLVAGGGIFIGVLLGFIISQAISVIDNPLIETTLTSVLAFGSYLVAEQLHVSGVLAVVAAGIVCGNLGPSRMSPTTRILVFNLWDYAAFLANSLVFLLIGLQIDLSLILADWKAILWAILAVLVARAASIYGLSWIGPGIPWRFKHVLYWGGLRGAFSLALALSLPVSLGADGTLIRSMAFGVVLFTLLVQGITMKPFINRMGIVEISKAQIEYENLHARAVIAKSAYKHLEAKYQAGMLSRHIWNTLSKPLEDQLEYLAEAATDSISAYPDVEARELESAIQETLRSERSTLRSLLRDGSISERTFTNLVHEIDTALMENPFDLIHALRSRLSNSIHILLTVILQEKDVNTISTALEPLGVPITRIASSGGFLGRKNATLLIGIPEGKQNEVISIIENAAQGAMSVEAAPGKTPGESTPMCTTLFTVEVERYEVL
jgi:CPA1 family monovalent cation:H+ antiporter